LAELEQASYNAVYSMTDLTLLTNKGVTETMYFTQN